ncbi:MAG: hypothetical protein ACK4SF_06180 [Algoriphagus aquaeductus]|jgi:hypothetical protein|uniref:DUF1735 domain-containing protein n=1 Tax=Algoriphagus aquaeductus TaxID=475299 RepID=A0A326RTH4_9BACT|nr:MULTISPECIES: hypothetical protein [Algoriphagus]PZV83467.1 hypothetical protein CLV31_10680 [Algoriphagus aquaeductus]
MKMLRYSFGLLASALIFLSSCRDFVEPNVPYKDFDTGAYLRTIARTSTSFNFFNLGASKFALTLEAVDIEDGKTVQTVEIRVRHRRLIPGVGLRYTPQNDVVVKTLQASDFQPNQTSRFLRASFEVTAAEAIAAVGLTSAQIEGGDVFEFRLVLNDKFGRRFSSDNVTTNVAGAPFYDSPFQYPVSVICPSDLAGTYQFDHIETFCGKTFAGSTTWTAVAATPGSYTVSDGTFGSWQQCYPDTWGNGNVRINDACGRLTMTGTDKYGDSYSMVVKSVTPQVLTFEWRNTYGEFGTVAVKSNTGKPWPSLR